MMRSLLCASVTLALLLGTVGCGSSLYRWGKYEQFLYDMHLNPGKADPPTQVALLSEQIEETRVKDQRVPPGLHAHLGYMYVLVGDMPAATEQFEMEKASYPESTVFIDGLLSRMKKE